MARITKNIYVIQKFISARSVSDALKNERKGIIVDVCLAIKDETKPFTPAIGFQLKPDGREDIDYGA